MPVLLYKDGGLVKAKQFKNPKYIGDPINTLKIFNQKEVDEIIILEPLSLINIYPTSLSSVETEPALTALLSDEYGFFHPSDEKNFIVDGKNDVTVFPLHIKSLSATAFSPSKLHPAKPPAITLTTL